MGFLKILALCVFLAGCATAVPEMEVLPQEKNFEVELYNHLDQRLGDRDEMKLEGKIFDFSIFREENNRISIIASMKEIVANKLEFYWKYIVSESDILKVLVHCRMNFDLNRVSVRRICKELLNSPSDYEKVEHWYAEKLYEEMTASKEMVYRILVLPQAEYY